MFRIKLHSKNRVLILVIYSSAIFMYLYIYLFMKIHIETDKLFQYDVKSNTLFYKICSNRLNS